MLIRDNHFSLGIGNEVREIVSPLIKFFDLNYFSFRRVYDDGRHIVLCTAPNWVKTYYKEKFYHKKETQKFTSDKAVRPIVWDFIKKDQFSNMAMQAAKDSGFDHAFTLVMCENGFTEILSLCAPPDKNTSEQYLLNFHYIENFVKYFKNEAIDLIRNCEKDPIITEQVWRKSEFTESEKTFIAQTKVKNLKMEIDQKVVTLSERQTSCASLLLKAKSPKEIAQILKLSSRTIESHIEDLKNKINCTYRSELIDILSRYKEIL